MQVVQALKYVMETGRQAQDVRTSVRIDWAMQVQRINDYQIIIGGDSAGGNLTLGVISASTHSHEGIPSLKLDKPLRGALLISPWTSFSTEAKSSTENADKDIVAANSTYIFRDDLISAGTKDEFAEPDLASSKWWADAPVSSILNLSGGYEIFRDYINDLGAKMKEAGLNIQTVECPQQVHIDCVLDSQSGLEPGPMTYAIWDWLAKIL